MTAEFTDFTELPLPTIRRYPLYLVAIDEKIAQGEDSISSAVLASELNLDPVMVRKDLAMTGIVGRPRVGYPARQLVDGIKKIIGWNDVTNALLVGAGSLGSALLGYHGFQRQRMSIVAAFDNVPELIGTERHNVKIYSLDEMAKIVPELNIKIGILTVPNSAAQECADVMVASGIRGIWNFTAVHLSLPENVKCQRVCLAQSLAVLSAAIRDM